MKANYREKVLKEKLNRIYYDWANDPEFVRIEKYPNDKTPADSFLSLIHQVERDTLEACKEIIGEDEKPTGNFWDPFVLGVRNTLRKELRAKLLLMKEKD